MVRGVPVYGVREQWLHIPGVQPSIASSVTAAQPVCAVCACVRVRARAGLQVFQRFFTGIMLMTAMVQRATAGVCLAFNRFGLPFGEIINCVRAAAFSGCSRGPDSNGWRCQREYRFML
jgi:hypothetical protein